MHRNISGYVQFVSQNLSCKERKGHFEGDGGLFLKVPSNYTQGPSINGTFRCSLGGHMECSTTAGQEIFNESKKNIKAKSH